MTERSLKQRARKMLQAFLDSAEWGSDKKGKVEKEKHVRKALLPKYDTILEKGT